MDTPIKYDPNSHYAIEHVHPAANTDHVKRKYLNVPYADESPSQHLDIYLPDDTEGPYPVIVSIHGGAFMGCDKADEQVLPMLEGLHRGYAVVSINYRLSWEALFPALIYDAKAAVRWIRAHADQYHFDPDRIASWGGSAGGYLSTMLCLTAGVPELEDLSMGNPDEPSHVTAAVDWFGPTNFLKMDDQLAENGLASAPGTEHSGPYSPESLLLGAQLAAIPDRVQRANPETYIRDGASPILIQHGTRDPVVPCQQSVGLAAKLVEAVGKENVILELLDGAGHGGPQFETPENVNRVLSFLDERLQSE